MRKREGLWGFWRTEMLGVVEARRESCGGWKKGREETRLGWRGKGVNGKVMVKERERIGRLIINHGKSGLGRFDRKVLARS